MERGTSTQRKLRRHASFFMGNVGDEAKDSEFIILIVLMRVAFLIWFNIRIPFELILVFKLPVKSIFMCEPVCATIYMELSSPKGS